MLTAADTGPQSRPSVQVSGSCLFLWANPCFICQLFGECHVCQLLPRATGATYRALWPPPWLGRSWTAQASGRPAAIHWALQQPLSDSGAAGSGEWAARGIWERQKETWLALAFHLFFLGMILIGNGQEHCFSTTRCQQWAGQMPALCAGLGRRLQHHPQKAETVLPAALWNRPCGGTAFLVCRARWLCYQKTPLLQSFLWTKHMPPYVSSDKYNYCCN